MLYVLCTYMRPLQYRLSRANQGVEHGLGFACSLHVDCRADHPSSFLVDEDHQHVWFLHVFNDFCHACNCSMQVGCGTFGA